MAQRKETPTPPPEPPPGPSVASQSRELQHSLIAAPFETRRPRALCWRQAA